MIELVTLCAQPGDSDATIYLDSDLFDEPQEITLQPSLAVSGKNSLTETLYVVATKVLYHPHSIRR